MQYTKQELTSLAAAEAAMQNIFVSILKDIQFVSSYNELFQFLHPERKKPLQDITAILLVFSKTTNSYDQIRSLATTGQEQVRINRTANGYVSIPKAQLQNKAGRYYFTETAQLKAGQLFISPFDLNVEHGAIEMPQKPTIRFGTPVYSRDGKLESLLVLNYLADKLLTTITDSTRNALATPWLVNNEGYWLMTPEQKDAWAFMYPSRRSRTFSNRYPAIWKLIKQNTSGHVLTDQGLFIYHTMTMAPENTTVLQIASPPQRYTWHLVSFIAAPQLAQITAGTSARIITQTCFVLFISALVLYFFLKIRLSREKLSSRMAQEQEISQILTDLAETLYQGNITCNACTMILNRCMYLTSSTCGIVASFKADTRELENIVCQGDIWFPETANSVLIDGTACPAGFEWVIRNRRSLWTNIPQEDSRLSYIPGESFPFFRLLALPVIVRDKLLGIIGLANADIDYTQRDMSAVKSITAFYGIALDQAKMQAHVARLTNYDQLTDLKNKHSFLTEVSALIREAEEKKQRIACVFITVEKSLLEAIELYGHETGGPILIETARRIQQMTNSTGEAFRISTHGFVALLTDVRTEKNVSYLTRKILNVVNEALECTEKKWQLHARAGISLFPEDATDPAQLLQKAEQTLKTIPIDAQTSYAFYTTDTTD